MEVNKMAMCPKCGFGQPGGGLMCQRCGIVFEKFSARQREWQEGAAGLSGAAAGGGEMPGPRGLALALNDALFSVRPGMNVFFYAGRAAVFLVIVVWGVTFILAPMESNRAGESFLHLVNLPFHEAGHVVFRPFGQFMMMLGGSLLQVLVPLVCAGAFLFQTRDAFAASVSLWWCGESLMDLAPYINDARALKLVLLGGVTGRDVDDYHDWEFILRKAGWLEHDHALARAADTLGILLMLLAFAWGGYLLFKQFRNLERT
jgi:hypothetical protein